MALKDILYLLKLKKMYYKCRTGTLFFLFFNEHLLSLNVLFLGNYATLSTPMYNLHLELTNFAFARAETCLYVSTTISL